MTVQAGDRDNNRIRTVDEYLQARRENIGARFAFDLGGLNLSIPDHAFYHPMIRELEYMIADLLTLNNVRLVVCFLFSM